MKRAAVCLFVLPSFLMPRTPATALALQRPPESPAARFKARVEYLASDALQGRGVGTRGIELAAQYIARHFEQLGLEPGADHGTYFQSFEMTLRRTLTDKSRLRIEGRTTTPRLRDDYIPFHFSAEETFNGPLVFCGYGIDAGDRNHDDFAGVDLTGKVALVVAGEPPAWADQNGHPTPHGLLRNKVYNVKDRGAVAVLVVNAAPPPGEADELAPFETDGPDAYGIPAFHVTRSLADAMLTRGGAEPLEPLEQKMRAGRSASLDVGALRVSGRVTFKTHPATTKNVVGVLPGAGPLADECVVLGAHYDHLGIRRPMMRTFKAGKLVTDPVELEIHNGADDNASGVSGLLEIARRLSNGPRPGRTVVFVAFTAEESGLHGSKYYVEHPACPLEKTVVMLNMDMIGRLDPDNEAVRVFGMDSGTGLSSLLRRAAESVGLSLLPSPDTGGRSDHAVFIRKGVPALHFFSGHHGDYHKPTDDADKINAEGGAKITALVYHVARELADRPERPAFQTVAGATDGRPREKAATYRVVMGIAPGYGDDGKPGMAVEDVGSEGPADLAGMKPGDRIIRIDGKSVANIYDYMAATRTNKPGDAVEVVVLRGGGELTLTVRLAAAR